MKLDVKKPYCSQRGAIMVFFILLLPVLFGFMGFGIDFGLLYVSKGKLQDVADAAALAGAAHIGEEDNDLNDGIDPVGKAVRAFIRANGLQIEDSELKLMEQTESAWEALGELADNENIRVAYGIINVNDKNRVRVRIDERVPIFFLKTLVPDWGSGVDVRAVAAAEGGTVKVPPFRIIGRNGVYDHFFNLANDSEDESKRWIDGSVYAGNLLRVSYRQKEPEKAINMFSVNGYIFADMLNTGLPLKDGVYKDSNKQAMERIIRSSYVRKKDGDNSLYGYDALSPTNMTVPGWGCTAAEKAEERLKTYSNVLKSMINSDIKTKALLKVDNNRYMCNDEVYKKLNNEEKQKLHKDRENSDWKNKQYSNIDKDQKEIGTLYVEIQGDSKTTDLKDGRDAAIWLGAWPYADKINKIGRIIVELHKTNENNGQSDLTGSFIINLGQNGVMEIGPVYSQANLIIRAAFGGNENNYIKFTDTVYSDKILSFSYDDVYAGQGFACHKFGSNVVLAADLVLFGYGYEIGPNVVTPKVNNTDEVQTHHYDDLTNYMVGSYTPSDPEDINWWKAGITTIDYVVVSGNPVFDMLGLKLSDEGDIQKNPNAQMELEQLKTLWGSVDKEDPHIYVLPTKKGNNQNSGTAYNLYGSLYGEIGRWPTEVTTNVGTDKNKNGILNCPMESISGIESASGKLRLVE